MLRSLHWIDRKGIAKDRDTSSAVSRGQRSYYSYLSGSIKYEKEESSDLLVVGYENYVQIISIQLFFCYVFIIEHLQVVFYIVLHIHTNPYLPLILKLHLLLIMLLKLLRLLS